VKGEGPDRTAEHKKKTMKTISSKSELQSRPEPLSTENRPKIDFAKRRLNRSLNTWRLLNLLRCAAPQFFHRAEVVGKWVWIQFQVEPPLAVRQKLAELGFHWNNVRQTWQHPCGTPALDGADYDPRKRYGSFAAVQMFR
jgi:hypothetical protein